MAKTFEKTNFQYLELDNKISQVSTISIWTSTVQWNKKSFSATNLKGFPVRDYLNSCIIPDFLENLEKSRETIFHLPSGEFFVSTW